MTNLEAPAGYCLPGAAPANRWLCLRFGCLLAPFCSQLVEICPRRFLLQTAGDFLMKKALLVKATLFVVVLGWDSVAAQPAAQQIVAGPVQLSVQGRARPLGLGHNI